MVDNGYWVECFPVSNSNVGPDLYSATTEAFPKVSCTGTSVDSAIENIRKRLDTIRKSYEERGMVLPSAHSLSSPTKHHRQEQKWMSVYVTLDD